MLDDFKNPYDRPSPSVSLALRFFLRGFRDGAACLSSLSSSPFFICCWSFYSFPPFFSPGNCLNLWERERSALFVCRCRHLSYLVCTRTYIKSFYRRREITYTHTQTPTKQSSARSVSSALVSDSLLKEYFTQKKIVIFYSPSTRYDVLFFHRTQKENICFHAFFPMQL